MGCSRTEPTLDAGTPGDARPPPVSLLQTTPVRLALEWQFEGASASAGGDRLAERWDPFTGWKGKWILLRIPRDAQVSAIRMKLAAPARLMVGRDKAKLVEQSFSAGVATVPIGEPGGEYRVSFVGEPVMISDLEVLGYAGAERKSVSGLPVVRRGSLEIGARVSGPWPALEAYCEKMGGDRCLTADPSTFGSEERARLRALPSNAGIARGGDGMRLALRTERGWFVLRDASAWTDVRAERPEAGAPFVSFVHVERQDMGGDFRAEAPVTHEVATRELVVCRFVDGWPDCDEHHTLGTWAGDVPLGDVPGKDAGSPAPFPPPSGQWNERRAPRVLGDGGIVLE